MSDPSLRAAERAVEQDRLALAQSLAALRDRFSPSALLAEGKEVMRSQAAPLLAQVDGAVRGQPLMAAVAGVAVAALVLGRRREAAADPAPDASALSGTRFEALSRWEDEGGPALDEPVDPDEDWLSQADALRQSARDLLRQIDTAARRGLAPASHLARHRAEVLAALARDTRAALGMGLETLTGPALDKAITARERLYMARIVAAEQGRQTVASQTVARHPMVTGALVAAAGALVASLFPPTRAEDRWLGETRDDLMEDAYQALRTEAIKASDLATALADALKSDVRRVSGLVRPRGAPGRAA
jgi:hypothetical protein